MVNFFLKISASLITFFVFFGCIREIKKPDLYGIWDGKHQNHDFSIIFDKENKCKIKYYNNEIGEYQFISGDWKIDFSKNPIPLSINKITKLNHSLHTILEFIDHDMIRIMEFSPKWKLRPIAFNSESVIELKRSKKEGNNESNSK